MLMCSFGCGLVMQNRWIRYGDYTPCPDQVLRRLFDLFEFSVEIIDYPKRVPHPLADLSSHYSIGQLSETIGTRAWSRARKQNRQAKLVSRFLPWNLKLRIPNRKICILPEPSTEKAGIVVIGTIQCQHSQAQVISCVQSPAQLIRNRRSFPAVERLNRKPTTQTICKVRLREDRINHKHFPF